MRDQQQYLDKGLISAREAARELGLAQMQVQEAEQRVALGP